MDHFLYRDGQLFAEDVSITDIAAEVGTPFYVYSTATLTRHFKLFDEALDGMPHLVCFAMKSLSNQAVIKTLAAAGAGMDVVSGGEYARVKAAGVPGDRIVFSGVGKTADEMRMALSGGDPAIQCRKRARDARPVCGRERNGGGGANHRACEPGCRR